MNPYSLQSSAYGLQPTAYSLRPALILIVAS